MKTTVLATSLLLGTTAHARSWALDGCTSSVTSEGFFTSMVWYNPDTDAICDMRYCGAGGGDYPENMAAPAYTGEATYDVKCVGGNGPCGVTTTTFSCGHTALQTTTRDNALTTLAPEPTLPAPTGPEAAVETGVRKGITLSDPVGDDWTNPSADFSPPSWAKTRTTSSTTRTSLGSTTIGIPSRKPHPIPTVTPVAPVAPSSSRADRTSASSPDMSASPTRPANATMTDFNNTGASVRFWVELGALGVFAVLVL